MRYLFACLVLACLSLSATPITAITITGIPSGGPLIQWNTPTADGVSDIWREFSGPVSYGAYADNELDVVDDSRAKGPSGQDALAQGDVIHRAQIIGCDARPLENLFDDGGHAGAAAVIHDPLGSSRL